MNYQRKIQTVNKRQSLRRMLLEASPVNTGNIPIHIAQQVFKQWLSEVATGGQADIDGQELRKMFIILIEEP